MERDVGPASDAELWGVLPGLKSVAMVKVMQGFPIVESLIAVLDRGVQRSEKMRGKA